MTNTTGGGQCCVDWWLVSHIRLIFITLSCHKQYFSYQPHNLIVLIKHNANAMLLIHSGRFIQNLETSLLMWLLFMCKVYRPVVIEEKANVDDDDHRLLTPWNVHCGRSCWADSVAILSKFVRPLFAEVSCWNETDWLIQARLSLL